MNYGTLYIIATPIGNLGDISYRAVETLKNIDILFAEDTRTTKKLLDTYNIQVKTYSYNAHASNKTHQEVLRHLTEGKNIGLVSDAGTPGISDPGSLLVSFIYEELRNTVSIVPIPGASALTAIVSICPLDTSTWTFYGFLPHKKGRQTLLEEIRELPHTAVFYESTHRIIKLLEQLVDIFKDSDKQITIGRELTKKFEDIYTGTFEEALVYITSTSVKQKGEFVICIGKLVAYKKK